MQPPTPAALRATRRSDSRPGTGGTEALHRGARREVRWPTTQGVRDRRTLDSSLLAPRDDARPAESNHLLSLLARESPAAYAQLLPQLERVTFDVKDVLYEPGDAVGHVYFPESGVYSLVKVMADGRRIEVGTTGNEGMIGLPVFLEATATVLQCFTQIAGAAKRLDAAAFRRAAAAGGPLHRILQRYAQYCFDQAGQSVACSQLHPVSARCARWLLRTHDRVWRAERFPLTQEFLAVMLGVRRASVSLAAEALQRVGLIRYRRGNIAILDRDRLEAVACECYQADRAAFDRLLGAIAT